MTVSMLLDYIAILTDANAAQNDDLTLNLTVTDENEQFYVTRKNGVLLSYPGENHPGCAGFRHLQASAALCIDDRSAGRAGTDQRRSHCPETPAGIRVQV